MAADAGAQRILDLLNNPNPLLGTGSISLAKASRKAIKKPYGVMPQYGVDALGSIRTFYRDLRTQIDAIETVDEASKASVIQALDTLDGSIGAYEASLELGMSRPALPKLRTAARGAQEAQRGLLQAINGLSQ
jgi:hypothetical protein